MGGAVLVAAALAVATQLGTSSPDAEARGSDVVAESSPAPTGDDAVPAAPVPVAEPGDVLYFTFDDGPSPTWTPRILDLLGSYGAGATFFQVGEAAAKHPTLVDLVRDRGHGVGNHTWNHPDLTRLSSEDVRDQLTRTTDVIGLTSCVRPPMGATNTSVQQVFTDLGLTEQLWDIDTRDWESRDAAGIVDAVLTQARNGAVILLHDGGGDRSATVAALTELLPRLTEAGWRIEGIPGC